LHGFKAKTLKDIKSLFCLSVKIRESVAKDLEKRMNRTYELMFIVRPDMTEEDLDKLIANLQSVVPGSGGTVKRVDKMGKRRLAYTVRRFHEGIYVLLVVEGGGAVIHELERRLRVTEPVIKFLTVRVDEEQKRLDKIKKLRDARKKVSAQPAAPAAAEEAAAPAAEAPATA
jgi:small subunit ribosomal protein S6